MQKPKCKFESCSRQAVSWGCCDAHYRQLKRGEDLHDITIYRPKGSPPIIVYNEVPCNNPELEGLCHEWFRAKDDCGYGQVNKNGRMVRVHRYVWELEYGKIPDGLEIDHMCKNRACCNVKHLRVVTHLENIKDVVNQNKIKTICRHGHPFDEKNTYFTKKGHRQCRTCNKIKWRKRCKREKEQRRLKKFQNTRSSQ